MKSIVTRTFRDKKIAKAGEFIMTFTTAERRIANIHSSGFETFTYPDGVALGDSILQLDADKTLGVGFHVYRMPPGMTTRAHRHNGPEQFLILEGELVESDGTVLKAGDMVYYGDGSVHNSHTPNGCLLAVHISEAETPTE
jgi:gentisate 1,2-dioxygenase